MNGQDFLRIVKMSFEPFLNGTGFSVDPPSISGRFYRASFSSPTHVVSLSFEPGDNAFFVMVFSRDGKQLSDIDDRSRTPRLSDLNSRYMHRISDEERLANESFFRSVVPKDDDEIYLLRCAKELRLVLPKYLKEKSVHPG